MMLIGVLGRRDFNGHFEAKYRGALSFKVATIVIFTEPCGCSSETNLDVAVKLLK